MSAAEPTEPCDDLCDRFATCWMEGCGRVREAGKPAEQYPRAWRIGYGFGIFFAGVLVMCAVVGALLTITWLVDVLANAIEAI